MTYYRLADIDRYGMIVRADKGMEYAYVPASNMWLRTGVLMHYIFDFGDCYDLYDEITEEEALKDVEAQRVRAGIVTSAPAAQILEN
jgi:hypothetical protein